MILSIDKNINKILKSITNAAFSYLRNFSTYWLLAPWRWRNSVEACSVSVIKSSIINCWSVGNLLFRYKKGRIAFLKLNIYISSLNVQYYVQLIVTCSCYGVSYVPDILRRRFWLECRFCQECSFSLQIVVFDILEVVAALYNAFQTCLQSYYEYGGRNVSSKHNYL